MHDMVCVLGLLIASTQAHQHSALPPSLVHFAAAAPAVSGFGPPHVGQRVVGASLAPPIAASTVDQCATACLAAPECNSFNWAAVSGRSTCEMNKWGSGYVVMQNTSWSYYSRVIERNDTAWNAAIAFLLQVP